MPGSTRANGLRHRPRSSSRTRSCPIIRRINPSSTFLIHLTSTFYHQPILTGMSTPIKVTECGERRDQPVPLVGKILDVGVLILTVTGLFTGKVTILFDTLSELEHWPLWPLTEAGASSNPCSETYAGPKAFSEPETQSMAAYLFSKRSQVKVYVSFHAYSQMWLTPWGYTSNVPSNFNDLIAKARAGADAVASVYGTRYTVGSSTRVLCEYQNCYFYLVSDCYLRQFRCGSGRIRRLGPGSGGDTVRVHDRTSSKFFSMVRIFVTKESNHANGSWNVCWNEKTWTWSGQRIK